MKIKWSDKEKTVLDIIGFSFDYNKDLTEDEQLEIGDEVIDYLLTKGMKHEVQEPSAIGEICEDIMGTIVRTEKEYGF